MILKGDCIKVMKAMKPNSVDAIVCDPPYGLEFMGKEWDNLRIKGSEWSRKRTSHKDWQGLERDRPNRLYMRSYHNTCQKCGKQKHQHNYEKCLTPEYKRVYHKPAQMQAMQLWHMQWLTEAYRVLKPGGSMLVMGGTRTSHRLACAIEDSGFIIKDTLMWIYGSGFPKAQDLGKMIKKRGGNGNDWDGFKVGGIKPAYEPIIWAVKPPEGSYVDNVLKWGVGAVNVDECRVGYESPADKQEQAEKNPHTIHADNEIYGDYSMCKEPWKQPKGRFPANVILDEEAGKMLDEQSGDLKSGGGNKRNTEPNTFRAVIQHRNDNNIIGANSGGASRFFYCAKASRGERNAGLDDLMVNGQRQTGEEERDVHWSSGHKNPGSFQSDGTKKQMKNNHPTVKPIKLFEYLIKLVTREGQIILDPFIGSGTTVIAAHNIGRKCIGIEKESEYLEIAKRRIDYWENQPQQLPLGE